jgi:hypothetical protein
MITAATKGTMTHALVMFTSPVLNVKGYFHCSGRNPKDLLQLFDPKVCGFSFQTLRV